MATLQYSSAKQGKVLLVTVGGSLDADTSPKFGKKLQEEMQKGTVRIVINMNKLDYIASAGMGVLISTNEVLSKTGGEIRISSMSEKIQKIFKLLGFSSLFKTFDSDEKAIGSFK